MFDVSRQQVELLGLNRNNYSEMLEYMKGFTGRDIYKFITEKVSEKFREVKDEEHEIESRKLYLVVFGIPESQGVSTDAYLTDDQSKLNSII